MDSTVFQILNPPIVNRKPYNCLVCCFNRDKYCSLKIAMGMDNTFVQNNRTNVCDDCPLKVE